MRTGVLAVQGDFREHAEMLQRLGANVVEVRKPDELVHELFLDLVKEGRVAPVRVTDEGRGSGGTGRFPQRIPASGQGGASVGA